MKRRDSHFLRPAIGALLLSLALSGAASAAANCNILTTGAVAFGPYVWTNPGPTDSVGTITYNCNSGAVVYVSAGSSGRAAQRTLLSGANTLDYNLYSDAARAQVWGDLSSGGGVPVSQSGKNTLNVYGRIPPGQNVASGTYNDTVTVTFLF